VGAKSGDDLRSRTEKESMMNLFTLTGNLGSDVQVKESNGTTFVHLSIADNYRVRKADGEGWENRVNWTRVTAFGPLAESLRILGKGSRVEVVGHLRGRVFEKDGVRFSYSEHVADSIDFVAVKKPGAGEAEAEPEAE
jgi:single-strand DNA-binding protein